MYVSLYWMVSKSNKLEYGLLLLIFVLCPLLMPVVMDRVNGCANVLRTHSVQGLQQMCVRACVRACVRVRVCVQYSQLAVCNRVSAYVHNEDQVTLQIPFQDE